VFPTDSIVFVKVLSTEIIEVPSRQGGSWEKIKFVFKILGTQVAGDNGPLDRFDSLIGEKLYGDAPFRFNDSSQNKLRQWAEAILGMTLEAGFELDTDYFDDKQCRAVTSQYEKKAKDPATGRPYKGHQVESLLPIGGKVLAEPAKPSVLDPWAAKPPEEAWTQEAVPAGQQGAAPWDDTPPF
jgi:hypothetical protein